MLSRKRLELPAIGHRFSGTCGRSGSPLSPKNIIGNPPPPRLPAL
jgi:hypothetical protein